VVTADERGGRAGGRRGAPEVESGIRAGKHGQKKMAEKRNNLDSQMGPGSFTAGGRSKKTSSRGTYGGGMSSHWKKGGKRKRQPEGQTNPVKKNPFPEPKFKRLE